MQARAREALAAGHDQLDQTARHEDAEQQQEDQIEVEKAEHQLGRGGDARASPR